jgi:hypothetical protein
MTEGRKPFQELSPAGTAPIATAQTIAALALNMAIQYHDVGVVKDGAMYQQYKLEGRNLQPLDLDMVFETAIKMEAYLMGADERISKMLVEAIVVAVEEDEKKE